MAPQLLKTVRMRGDAKTVLRSTPLVSALVVIRLLAEGDDPYLVRDVIEPASSRGPAPGEGRPNPA